MVLIFVAYLNYLVDTYLMYAASAIAANTVARSACGAAAPLYTNQMFHALGVGGGGSLIAGVGTVLAIIPILFYKYGRSIRVRSKFAPTDMQKSQKRHNEEEANPADYHQADPNHHDSSDPPSSPEPESDVNSTSNHHHHAQDPHGRDIEVPPTHEK